MVRSGIETGMSTAGGFSPLRNLRDIEDLERVPLEQRLLSWDANDWIRAWLDLAPQKVAIRYVADGNPESPAVDVTYRELKQRAFATANLFHSLGVGPGDAVLYLMPTIPALYTVMLGSLAAGIACCTNWMLKPAHWLGLDPGLARQGRRRARADARLRNLGEASGHPRRSAGRREHPVGADAGRCAAARFRLSRLLASKQPGDRLIFTRKAEPDDIAAYIHSGGTTGSPKLVRAHASRLLL